MNYRYPPKQLRKQLALLLLWLGAALMLAMVLFYGYQLMQPDTLPFKKIKVIVSANHVLTTALANTVHENLNGGFFSLNAKQLKLSLEKLPWVNNVALERSWPDTLIVIVDEQVPLAVWNNQAVINVDGQLFTPDMATVDKHLPILSGPKDKLPKVLTQFQNYAQQLAPYDLAVAKLSLSEQGDWQMALQNGVEIMLGQDEIDKKFDRFLAIYPRLVAIDHKPIHYIDLRYPNGFAVR